MKKLLTLLVTVTGLTAFAGTNPKTNINLPKKDLCFTENKGQVMDQNRQARPDIFFSAWDGKINYHFGTKGISYQLNKVTATATKKTERMDIHALPAPDKIQIYRVDLQWRNSNPSVELQSGSQQAGLEQYYFEGMKTPATGVKSFNDIIYKNIYSGIDLHYYGSDGILKYDFIVSPGADYRKIQLEIKGAEVFLQKDGSVLLKTPLGDIHEGAPVVFQNKKKLQARWKLNSSILEFEIKGIDPSMPFVIDPPTRLWGTYYGGTTYDKGKSVASDASGNVYMAGFGYSTNAIGTTGAHQVTFAGTYDGFLIKFNSSGVRQWGTYYGTSADETAYGLCVDGSGDVYITGYTASGTSTVIATAGSHQSNAGGGNDAYLAKFNSSGVRQWATFYGGSGNDYGQFCTADASGNIFVTGSSASSSQISTIGTHQSSNGGGSDGFLAKFNSSGVRQWGTYYGGSGSEYVWMAACDASGNVFISGETASSSGIASSGAHQVSNGGGSRDAFLVKLNSSNGVRIWGTYYGGSDPEYGRSCSIDPAGNIYMGDHTSSTSGISTTGAHQTSLSGTNNDAYLVKFNTSGVRQWATYYGGSGTEYEGVCTCDNSGNVYLEAYSSSTSGIATAGSWQQGNAGGYDCFLVKFNSSGTRQWGSFYGGNGDETGAHCTLDASGNILICGDTDGASMASVGAHQTSYGGGIYDCFLVKFDVCIPSQPGSVSGPSVLCAGTAPQVYSITAVADATAYAWVLPGGWSGTSSTNSISVNTGTTGLITVAASNSCGVSPTTALSVTINPTPTIGLNTGSICAGQTFVLQGSGANTYTYSSTNATVTPATTSTYSAIGTSSSGCVSTASAVTTITVAPTPTITVGSGSVCAGNSFTISPSGASSYTVTGSNFTVTPGSITSYSVTGTGTNGCVSASPGVLQVTVNPLPTIGVNSGAICQGNTVVIVPNGASTYTITGGTFTVSPSTTTSYSVSGTSSLGCQSSSPGVAVVTVNLPPSISVNSGSICTGNSFIILPSGAFSYTVTGNNFTVSPTTTSSYSVTGTSAAGCISTVAVVSNVMVNSAPAPTIAAASGSVCAGTAFNIVPSGASTYTITGNNFSVTPSVTTSYSVTGTNNAGCISTNTAVVSVTVHARPNVTATAVNSVICAGGQESGTLIANGALTYVWSSAGGGSTVVVTPTITTNYYVLGMDALGCINSATVTLTVDACLGINKNNEEARISVYPVPFSTELVIEGIEGQCLIRDELGRTIRSVQLNANRNVLDLSDLASGVYFLSSNEYHLKIIKE